MSSARWIRVSRRWAPGSRSRRPTATGTLPLNLVRFKLLDRGAENLYLDWDAVADDTVAALRIESGRNPLDSKLSDLVGV